MAEPVIQYHGLCLFCACTPRVYGRNFNMIFVYLDYCSSLYLKDNFLCYNKLEYVNIVFKRCN